MRNWILVLLGVLSCAGHAATEKAWTLLVFMNGHNDLSSYSNLNLNQMEKVGSSGDVNIVVQWANMDDPDHTRRLYVTQDADTDKVTSPSVEDLGRVDMGDPAVLKEFLLWGMRAYPARHYMAVVWDHGSGWHGVRPQDISWDEISGNFITTLQLGKTMRDVAAESGRRLDLYASDACLMQMAEIAAQMQGSVDFIAGSQDYEPGEGWPYDKFLAELVQNPSIGPAELGAALSTSYVKTYEQDQDAAFSTIDMSRFAEFEKAVKDLGEAIAHLNKSALALTKVRATWTQNFATDDGDLGNFAVHLRDTPQIGLDPALLQRVLDSVRAVVVTNSVSTGYSAAQGLSVWLPRSKADYERYKSLYSQLDFEHTTGWSGALSAILN